LDRHYARAEISAKLGDDVLVIDEPRNINRVCDLLHAASSHAEEGANWDVDFAFPQNLRAH